MIVQPGGKSPRDSMLDYTFISIRSAKVFRTWQECKGQWLVVLPNNPLQRSSSDEVLGREWLLNGDVSRHA
jgi:hypothetical protein